MKLVKENLFTRTQGQIICPSTFDNENLLVIPIAQEKNKTKQQQPKGRDLDGTTFAYDCRMRFL